MAPETAESSSYDKKSDIWSLGLLLLECAFGQFPYDRSQFLDTLVNQEPPSAPQDKYSSEFCSFISSCLQKDPKKRKSAQELLNNDFLSKYDIQKVDLGSFFQHTIDAQSLETSASEVTHAEGGQVLRKDRMCLSELPNDVNCEILTVISLMDNKLSVLPENLSCPNLHTLNLHTNLKLRTIPDAFFNSMTALEILDLSWTRLKALPDSLFQLLNLKKLFLKYCELLARLPPQVRELKLLEVLDLEGTTIVALPKEVEELKKLKSLKVSFCEPMSYGRSDQLEVLIPNGVIPALSQLEELIIDVSPEDKQWRATVQSLVDQILGLEKLSTLEFYFPEVQFLPLLSSLSCFCIAVGDPTDFTISRLPPDAEFELEHHDKRLKYVNGEDIPKQIKTAIECASAFFLDRHKTVQMLSDFGITHMTQLKCCIIGECDKLQAIIDLDKVTVEKEVGLGSLEYLYIYYAKSLQSIWKGQVDNKSFTALKSLTLQTCLQLTVIFTSELLANLARLEELVIDDCPKITKLVSCDNHDKKQCRLALKKIMLRFLPGLDSISDVSTISPNMEFLSLYDCPNVKNLSISEDFNKNLQMIEGESAWWDYLDWNSIEEKKFCRSIFYEFDSDGHNSYKRDNLLESTKEEETVELEERDSRITPEHMSPSLDLHFSGSEGKASEYSLSKDGDKLEPETTSLVEGMELDLDNLETMEELRLGISTVQLVRHKHSKDRLFALKVLRGKSEYERQENAEEVEINKSIQSQYVVRYFNSFIGNDEDSILLEYMDCGSLADLMKEVQQIPEPYLAAICKQLLQGLCYLHDEKHIIHGNLEPSNLLINQKGEIKITDFGSSEILGGTYDDDHPGHIVGDPHGIESDIWSLGFVVLQGATGQFPYDDFPLYQALEKPPLAVSRDHFSEEFCSFISSCLQKDPRDRPSAKQLLQHPFIYKYEDEQVDLSSLFKKASKHSSSLEKDASKAMTSSHYQKHKAVLKVWTMTDDKTTKKTMKAVSGINGVDSVAAELKDQKLTVIGSMDINAVVKTLKKVQIISFEPAKDGKKENEEE